MCKTSGLLPAQSLSQVSHDRIHCQLGASGLVSGVVSQISSQLKSHNTPPSQVGINLSKLQCWRITGRCWEFYPVKYRCANVMCFVNNLLWVQIRLHDWSFFATRWHQIADELIHLMNLIWHDCWWRIRWINTNVLKEMCSLMLFTNSCALGHWHQWVNEF